MDANGSRYHALLTWSDWAPVLPILPEARELEWSEAGGGSGPLAVDCGAGGLALKALLAEFKPASAGDALAEQPGSGGAFDAWGNLYWLAEDRYAIRIRSAGSGGISDFWPVAATAQDGAPRDGIGAIEGLTEGLRTATGNGAAGGFRPVEPQPVAATYRLDALTVTRGHYLVAASAAAGGLLIFDLHGAGPPLFQAWPGFGQLPDTTPPSPAGAEALVALEDGGIGALADGWLWRLGPGLKPQVPRDPGGSPFHPSPPAPAGDTPQRGALAQPCLLDLRPALGAASPDELRAIRIGAVAALRGDRLLVVGRRPLDGREAPLAGVMRLDGSVLAVLDRTHAEPHAAGALDALIAAVVAPDPVSGERQRPPLALRALAVDYGADAANADAPFSFLVLAEGGDQAFRFRCEWHDGALAIGIESEFLPLRRYLGAGLASLAGGLRLGAYPAARVFYATQGRWAPLLALPQPRYLRSATAVTAPWDSGTPACVWHRIALDLRLPPGTTVRIETRAADTSDDLEHLPWLSEPGPQRAPGGSELPWRCPGHAPDAANGTWGTLLQAAHGRWLQVRVTLVGDGKQTPLLRALRAWYPRFSYASQYLPPVYRGDPASADFLDRFLALFEAEFTRWEDRIAAAQWLFDARTAPAATLEWLAGWVGLAFDPAVDEARRRLLIRYAVTSHARRGTVPGLLLAATLAWESAIDEQWLRAPEALAERPHGLRLQELFGLAPPLPALAWNPATQSRAQLLALLGGDPALADPQVTDPQAPGAAARHAALLRAFGFMPRAALEEARLWQAWTAARATAVEATALAEAFEAGDTVRHQAAGDALVAEPLPADEGASPEERSAWADYLAASRRCAPLRQRWQDFLARRWRRVSALNAAWGTAWRGFDRIPSPLALPAADAALADWHRFESRALRGLAGAHRFRIVLPLPGPDAVLDLDELARRRAAVLRVVEAEKPAHTVAEVRFGFDLFRIGEARLGLDTRLEAGLARRPELAALGSGNSNVAPAILGRTDLGGARLAPARPLPPADRVGLDRG